MVPKSFRQLKSPIQRNGRRVDDTRSRGNDKRNKWDISVPGQRRYRPEWIPRRE